MSDQFNQVMAIIAAMPAEGWHKLNAGQNRLDSIFPPLDLRAEYGAGSGVPAPWDRILGAWGGFGWDPINHRLVQVGGGHANSSCNGAIEWRLDTLQWHLAFHDSEMVLVSPSKYRSVDYNKTPVSFHAYGNNHYLPQLDRFVTMGGATYNDGNGLFVYDDTIPNPTTHLRRAACYTLDMSQARQGKVAGQTGSNNKRGAYAGVNLPGADAWYLRDWWNKPANARPTFNGGLDYLARIDCGADYLTFNGHDSLLYTSSPGTAKSVLMVEYVDQNGDNDIHRFIGGFDGDGEGQGQVAYSPTFQVFIKSRNGGSATTCFRFVDLKNAWGSANNWKTCNLTGSDLSEFLALDLTDCGVHWNPVKGCFTVHFYSPQVWEIYPPAGNPTPEAGWALVKPAMAAAGPTGLPRTGRITSGAVESEAGVIGKVKWAPDMNGAIKIEGNTAGDVWFYKPTGWFDPRN